MTEYTGLVKALRCCIQNPPETCVGCTYNIGNNECNVKMMVADAAAAIEALQAEVKRLNMRCADCEYGNSEWPEDPEHTQLPKRGKWIKDEEQSQKHVEAIYTCSACHNFDAWGVTELYPYCPNCGAKMEVQDADK